MAGWRDITRVDYDDGALHKRQGIDPSGAVTYRPLRDWWSGSAAGSCGLHRPQGHPSPEEGKKKDVRCVTTTRTRGNYYYFFTSKFPSIDARCWAKKETEIIRLFWYNGVKKKTDTARLSSNRRASKRWAWLAITSAVLSLI